MMLVEDGKLRLDDPVSKYIPAFADMKVGVEKKDEEESSRWSRCTGRSRFWICCATLRGCPTASTATTPCASSTPEPISSTAMSAMPNSSSASPGCRWPSSPGTLWDYGHATDVLGRVVEVISGKSLLQFEKERLLDPLGMSETAFFVADGSKRRRIAEPMPNDRAISPVTQVRDPLKPRVWESGGGGMVGTITDYARFCQMLLNGGTLDGRRYLKPETIALMATDHIGPETKIARDQLYYPGATSGFGLGFAVRTSVPPNTEWPLGEYRWDGVGGTFFFIDPTDDMFAIFMVQTPSQRGRIQLELKTLIYKAMEEARTLKRSPRTISRTCPTISSICAAVTSRCVQALMRPSIIASSTPRGEALRPSSRRRRLTRRA